jgi:hypothetical protein
MGRAEFLHHAGLLQDFILESIEEFCEGSGLPFDRKAFLQETSVDFAQVAVESLVFGTEAYAVDCGFGNVEAA